jgi:hypothetical protein
MRRSANTLYCFSPPAMVATFITELILLAYTLIRYRLSVFTRVVVLSLFLLALFQLAEYNVCGGLSMSAAAWSRTGYVAITMLPPLGVHLAFLIAKRGWRWIKWLAYANGLVWAVVFGTSQRAFTGYVCAGNYVIFQLNTFATRMYGWYYFFWLFVGMGIAIYFSYQTNKKRIKTALQLLVAGYLVFLLPTAIVRDISPASRAGLPSIMCGFAVIYAFILVFGIVPLVQPEVKASGLPAKIDNKKP